MPTAIFIFSLEYDLISAVHQVNDNLILIFGHFVRLEFVFIVFVL